MQNVSIVIRAYNESAQLEDLLQVLRQQQYPGEIELIVVDNGSTDDTADVARRAGARVVHLQQIDFTYPKSLNIGIAAASNDIVICIVGHAIPIGQQWIDHAVRPFADPHVVGTYGAIAPKRGATLIEQLLYTPGYYMSRIRGVHVTRKATMGVFGATNLAIRRSVWETHPFDEAYAAGGEDQAWAAWALASGKLIVRVPRFSVRHSHDLHTWHQYYRQIMLWHSLKEPRPFDRAELLFRTKKRD